MIHDAITVRSFQPLSSGSDVTPSFVGNVDPLPQRVNPQTLILGRHSCDRYSIGGSHTVYLL